MNQNIAIGIIVYQPQDSVLERIKDTIDSGYKVYLFDNSPDISIIRDYVYQESTDHSMVTYITSGKNVGLGFGISVLCAHAYYDSFSTMLFFDQDTVYSRITLDYISEFYVANISLSEQYSAITFNSKSLEHPLMDAPPVKDVRLVINSGSLYYLSNLKKMNWHDTTFFVDCVDYAFCLSSSHHRFKLGEHAMTPGFDHCSEQGDERYKVFGIVIPMRAYRFSRIWDTYTASVKLIFRAIFSGNFKYAFVFFMSINKYLFVQFYYRFAKLFHIKSC